MKRILFAMLLAAAPLLSLPGCSNKDDDPIAKPTGQPADGLRITISGATAGATRTVVPRFTMSRVSVRQAAPGDVLFTSPVGSTAQLDAATWSPADLGTRTLYLSLSYNGTNSPSFAAPGPTDKVTVRVQLAGRPDVLLQVDAATLAASTNQWNGPNGSVNSSVEKTVAL